MLISLDIRSLDTGSGCSYYRSSYY